MNQNILKSKSGFPTLSMDDQVSKKDNTNQSLSYSVVIESKCESAHVQSTTKVKKLLSDVTDKYKKRFATAEVVCTASPDTDPENTVATWLYESPHGDIRVICNIDFSAAYSRLENKIKSIETMNLVADLLSRFYALFVKSSNLTRYYTIVPYSQRIKLNEKFYDQLYDDTLALNERISQNNDLFDDKIGNELVKEPAKYPLLSEIIKFGENRGFTRLALIKCIHTKMVRNSETHANIPEIYHERTEPNFLGAKPISSLRKEDFQGLDITFEDFTALVKTFNSTIKN